MGEHLQIVPAGRNVEAQYVEMMVPLYSFGCERKIKNALANLKGKSIHTNKCLTNHLYIYIVPKIEIIYFICQI